MNSIKINSIGNMNAGTVKMNKSNNSRNLSVNYDSFSPSFKQAKMIQAPAKNFAKTVALAAILGVASLTGGCQKQEVTVQEQPFVMPEMPEEIKLFQESEQYLTEHPEKVQEGLDFIFSLGIIDDEHQAEIMQYSEGGKRFFVVSMIISNEQVREWYLNLNP